MENPQYCFQSPQSIHCAIGFVLLPRSEHPRRIGQQFEVVPGQSRASIIGRRTPRSSSRLADRYRDLLQVSPFLRRSGGRLSTVRRGRSRFPFPASVKESATAWPTGRCGHPPRVVSIGAGAPDRSHDERNLAPQERKKAKSLAGAPRFEMWTALADWSARAASLLPTCDEPERMVPVVVALEGNRDRRSCRQHSRGVAIRPSGELPCCRTRGRAAGRTLPAGACQASASRRRARLGQRCSRGSGGASRGVEDAGTRRAGGVAGAASLRCQAAARHR